MEDSSETPTFAYDNTLQQMQRHRHSLIPPGTNWKPVFVSSLNGAILGAFIGGVLGMGAGLILMLKRRSMAMLPAAILGSSLGTAGVVGVVTAVMKQGSL